VTKAHPFRYVASFNQSLMAKSLILPKIAVNAALIGVSRLTAANIKPGT